MLIVAPIVLTVVIVFRIADQPSDYLSWGVFGALIISGITTVLQAVRVGRIGAGHVLIMGTSGAFIAVCVAALVKGGPVTMASLIVISSFFQFLLAARLSLLRRIFTPVVPGTVIMLIAVTVMPIAFDSLTDVPVSSSSAAAPIAAFATLATVVVLRSPGASFLAAVVTTHRHRSRLYRVDTVRYLRCATNCGCTLDRSPIQILAWV